MPKNKKIKKEDKKKTKYLTPEEVAKYSPPDHAEQIQDVMGFGVQTAYDIGVSGGATVAKATNKINKLGNVDKLPTPVRKNKKK